MSAPPTDAEVVSRVLDGDTEAFAILVERYQDEFAGYAKYMTGSLDEAAEVMQESLVRAFRSLKRCGDPSRFKGWLFRIVSNQCKTHLARRRRRRLRNESLTDLEREPVAPHDPARDAEQEDLRRRVHEAMQELTTEQREALVLKYVEGMSLPEMAEFLAVSVPALKMRLARGREALRARLEGMVA